MWSSLRSRCHTLLHLDGPCEAMDVGPCGSAASRAGCSGEPQAFRASSPARSLSPLTPLVVPRRGVGIGSGHNCVTDGPQILEITLDRDGEDLRRGPGGATLGRRDSYSRHAPWGGKKKHSCSTKTQSSLEAERRVGGRASRAAGRRERRYAVSSIQEMAEPGGGAGGGGGDRGGGSSGAAGRSLSARSLRQRLRDTMGLCLPLSPRRRSRSTSSKPASCSLTFSTVSSASSASSSSSSASSAASSSCTSSSSKRKIHLTELMLETCPFPPGSDLANKWHLIKQHTAPVTLQASSALLTSDPSEAGAASANAAGHSQVKDSFIINAT